MSELSLFYAYRISENAQRSQLLFRNAISASSSWIIRPNLVRWLLSGARSYLAVRSASARSRARHSFKVLSMKSSISFRSRRARTAFVPVLVGGLSVAPAKDGQRKEILDQTTLARDRLLGIRNRRLILAGCRHGARKRGTETVALTVLWLAFANLSHGRRVQRVPRLLCRGIGKGAALTIPGCCPRSEDNYRGG